MDQENNNHAKAMWIPDRKKRTNMDAFREEVNRKYKDLNLGGKLCGGGDKQVTHLNYLTK